MKKKDQPQIKRTRARASEPEGKGGKKKSSTIELSSCKDTAFEEELRLCKEERDTCQVERDALKLKESLPKYLYVQQADKCVVRRGGEDGQFILESSAFFAVTERFTDKPFRYETSLSTDEWFASRFNDIFGDDSPNTALAMVQDDESKGTVVAVYSFAYPGRIQDGDTVYAYKMYQSTEQAGIKSLETLLGDKTEITIDHCSLFIDDAQAGTIPIGSECFRNIECESKYCKIYDWGSDKCNELQSQGFTGCGVCQRCCPPVPRSRSVSSPVNRPANPPATQLEP